MHQFKRVLAERSPALTKRRWFLILEDQLSDKLGPFSREEPRTAGIVLIESTWKAQRRPYHRQKLALLWSNLRHFALEQAARGVAVRYLFTDRSYRDALGPVLNDLGTVTLMEPAEREMRADLSSLVAKGGLQLVPHEGWLTTREQFRAGTGPCPPWRMDRFYLHVRRQTGLLMKGTDPLGGNTVLIQRIDAHGRESPPSQHLRNLPLMSLRKKLPKMSTPTLHIIRAHSI